MDRSASTCVAERHRRATAGPLQEFRERTVAPHVGAQDAARRLRPLRRSTTAPAPSPNSTHVLRSFQSTMELIFSAPTTRMVSATPRLDEPFGHRHAVDPARCMPPRCRRRRRASAPSSAWRSTAVAGSRRSAVAVLRTIASISPGATPARCHRGARRRAAMTHVVSFSAAMCRSAMPVRSTIHSCDVSMTDAPRSHDSS